MKTTVVVNTKRPTMVRIMKNGHHVKTGAVEKIDLKSKEVWVRGWGWTSVANVVAL